jgi:ribulose-5-phosphate 4-epimerase/fuculose-1-phosphate aldolase
MGEPSTVRSADVAAISAAAKFGTAEWQARCDLAAAYRLAALYGWTDLLGTHFSLRVPGTKNEFLINPFGLLFEEITASSLIRIDAEGNRLSESPYKVNRAGFVIHSALHMGRDDAHCVMHCHTRDGAAVSMQAQGLLPSSQRALTIAPQLRYHDYEGVAVDMAERASLQRDLGDGGMLILRNHGTLTVGATVGEAFFRMYRLEAACSLQIAALSGGGNLYPVAESVMAKAAGQVAQVAGMDEINSLVWAALKRKLEREGIEYAV